MSPSSPLVSIVVPSYNQGPYIEETLESLFSQTYAPLEILVLDGASKDETLSVLKKYDGRPGLWWKSEPDKGVVDAVNQGLARASGEFCGILSSDDCYTPDAVESAIATFRRQPDLTLVYADAEYIDAASKVTGRTCVGDYSLNNLLARRTFIMQSSAFFRTKSAQSLGGWRPEVSYVADNDLWLRMALVGNVARVPGIWSRYRIHETQRDTQSQRIVRDWQKSIDDLWPQLNSSQRRAARFGCHLTEFRYPGTGKWNQSKALYSAVTTDPRCLFWKEFPRNALLQPMRQVLSTCKRALRGSAPLESTQGRTP